MSETNEDSRIKPVLNITGGGEDSDLVFVPNMAAMRCSLKSCRGIKFSLLLMSLLPPLLIPFAAAAAVNNTLLSLNKRLLSALETLAKACSPLQRG